MGAVAGHLIGNNPVPRRTAALIGAGVGALAGGAIGNYMDNQEAELRAQLQGTGVSVTRVGDRIVLNMPSNVTFATDQDQVIPPFYPTLDSVAIVLRKFDKTLIDVDGHTDSVGNAGYNMDLSNRRANSVANYLASRGVDPRRMSAMGYGLERPIASNATEMGRAQNRRVEISISPLRQG
jgi:outer membrane protein OmpA-like peptidoglycan-associated protein